MARILLILVVLLVAGSCRQRTTQEQQSDPMAKALDKAGRNRGELEKVLDHYSNDPEKLAAARWLIINMPGHYSYSGSQLDSMETELNKLRIQSLYSNSGLDSTIIERWNSLSFTSLARMDDIRSLKADYLIKNIDMAFEQWKCRAWNKELPFEDFCELLLPYNIGDEPMSNWREEYIKAYGEKLDLLYQGDDAVKAARVLDSIISAEHWLYNDELIMPHRHACHLLKNRVGYNRDIIDLKIYAMRALGIPVAIDVVLVLPRTAITHHWIVVRDNITKRYIPFGYDGMIPDRNNYPHDKRKKGKVYRTTFARQNERMDKLDDIRSLPVKLVNPFLKDVSNEYFEPVEVKLPVKTNKNKVYLSLSGATMTWQPVDVGVVDKDSVTFTDFESGVFFVPTIVEGDTFYPCGDAFYVNDKGKAVTVAADTNNMMQVRISEIRSIERLVSKDGKESVTDILRPTDSKKWDNAHNKVKEGHHYRLDYLAGTDGWKSIGEATPLPGTDYVEFVAPGNALLRAVDITNNSGGQIFIFKNGQQCYSINLGFYRLLP